MTKLVDVAREIASQAHAGQTRRDGSTPYIVHPESVATRVADEESLKAAAWLHDVLEDTEETSTSLRAKGITDEVIQIVEMLTHDDDTPYLEYVASIAQHRSASQVKIADILTNLSDSPSRRQIRKYANALLILVPEEDD